MDFFFFLRYPQTSIIGHVLWLSVLASVSENYRTNTVLRYRITFCFMLPNRYLKKSINLKLLEKTIEQIPAFGPILRSAGLVLKVTQIPGWKNLKKNYLNKYWIEVQYYVLFSRLSRLRPSSYSAAREEVVAQIVI